MPETEEIYIDFPHADLIDSRDLAKLADELTDRRDDEDQDWPLDEEEEALLELLTELESDISEWTWGATLIADSYFTEYAREFATDVVYIDREGADHWPYTNIDWEGAAEDLQADFTSYEIDGRTYWSLAT